MAAKNKKVSGARTKPAGSRKMRRTRRASDAAERVQLFGHYNGIVTTAEGEHLAIGDLVGWVEDHKARW